MDAGGLGLDGDVCLVAIAIDGTRLVHVAALGVTTEITRSGATRWTVPHGAVVVASASRPATSGPAGRAPRGRGRFPRLDGRPPASCATAALRSAIGRFVGAVPGVIVMAAEQSCESGTPGRHRYRVGCAQYSTDIRHHKSVALITPRRVEDVASAWDSLPIVISLGQSAHSKR